MKNGVFSGKIQTEAIRFTAKWQIFARLDLNRRTVMLRPINCSLVAGEREIAGANNSYPAGDLAPQSLNWVWVPFSQRTFPFNAAAR